MSNRARPGGPVRRRGATPGRGAAGRVQRDRAGPMSTRRGPPATGLGPEGHLPQRSAVRRAARATSSCSALTRPGLTLTRISCPSTSTGRCVRAAGHRSGVGHPDPERPGLGPEHGPQRPAPRRVGQDVDHVPGPPLLHDHGGQPGVVGARLEQGGHGMGQLLAGGVVDVGLEQGHGWPASASGRPGAGIRSRSRRRPPGSTRTPITTWVQLGSSSSSRVPAPKPWPLTLIAGIGPEAGRQRGQQGGPGRGGQLHRDVAALGGHALEQRHHRRRRVGQHAVGGADHARCPVATGLARTSSTPSTSRAAHGARPRRRWRRAPDLVEVDLVDRPAVQAASTSARAAKVARARRATRSGSRASSTSPTMWAWVRTTTVSCTVTTACVAAMPPRSTGSASRPQPPNGQPLQQREHLVEVGAGVEQAAEGHVPGDAGEAVEPGRRVVDGGRPSADRRHGSDPGHRAGGAEPVVDADHGDARPRTRRAWPAAR